MSYYQMMLKKHGIKPNPYIYESKVFKADIVKRRANAYNEDGLKVCCVCHTPKGKDDFSPNKNRKDGLDARCKPCKSMLAKRYK